VKDRMVSDVLQNEGTIEWLAGKIRELMDIGSNPAAAPMFIDPTRRQTRSKTLDRRNEALSEAVAALAHQRSDVERFRSTILEGQLIRFEDVEKWIEDRRSDCTHQNAIIVRLKKGTNV